MQEWNKILRFIVLVSIFISLASVANSQMNRDSPLLSGKLPTTADESTFNKDQMSGSSFMISEPFNGQANSDLMVSPDQENTTCNQVSFQLTLTPAPSGSTGYQKVLVSVLEGIASQKTVAELTILMPVSGGSVHEIIGFSSLPPETGQNKTREITVIADSDNKIKETDEGNNAITLQGTCPG